VWRVDTDDVAAGFSVSVLRFTQLARHPDGLLFLPGRDPALRQNIAGKIPLVSGGANRFHSVVKPARQALVPDPATFPLGTDRRNTDGVKLRDPPCRCPGRDGGGDICQRTS